MSQSAFRVRSYLLAAVVALGLSAAWCFVVGFVVELSESTNPRRAQYDQLYVGRDGQPYIFRYSLGANLPTQEVLTLEGAPTKIQVQSLLNPMYTSRRPRVSQTDWPAWSSRLAGVNDGGARPTYWYLVHDGRPGGRAYGIGYHAVSRQVMGYFGRKGFADRMPPQSEWFEVAGDWGLSFSTVNPISGEPQHGLDHVLYLLAEGKLWAIDPQQRQVGALADVPSGATIGWIWDLKDGPQERPEGDYSTSPWAARKLIVRWDEACMLVDPRTGDHATYALSQDLGEATYAGVQLTDGNLLLVRSVDASGAPAGQLTWLDPKGKVVRRRDVRLLSWSGGSGGVAMFGWIVAAALPLPAGQLPTILLVPNSLVINGQESYWSAVGTTLAEIWPALLMVAAIGGASAVGAYRRQRRLGLPNAVGWAVFAFLFGAPGWIAYRWHRVWPPMEDCPACGQRAPRDRASCTECGVRFPPPAMKGIEVFA